MTGVPAADRPRLIRVGTRASLLARTQTEQVLDLLRAAVDGTEFKLVDVVTAGDRSVASLASFGGTGVFVSALREALLAGRIDVAVHSFKDLPTGPEPGVVVAAVPVRQDPREALVASGGRQLAELPAGARVGTGSPRRAAQLRALGRGLEIIPIRGNVDTRLRRVGQDLDAVVVAAAGLARLGNPAGAVAAQLIDTRQMLPAPAQGALAVECRAADSPVRAVLATIDDPVTRQCVTAERAVLAALAAGCSSPVGALAQPVEHSPSAGGPTGGGPASNPPATGELLLRASVTAPDGGNVVAAFARGPVDQAEQIGQRLAGDLLTLGAETILGTK